MFTGIVEEVGKVTEVRRTGTVTRISVNGPKVAAGTQVNDSVSVNGVCLTVTACLGTRMAFDAVTETLQRSTLRYTRPGENVNLERALAVGGRVGGHFVLGHVDGTGRIVSVHDRGADRIIRIHTEPELMRLMVYKGSVAVDGVSLTVAELDKETFSVAIIPHTLRNTTFREHREGDTVNIEADILGKYVDRLLGLHVQEAGLTVEKLAAAGFMLPGSEVHA